MNTNIEYYLTIHKNNNGSSVSCTDGKQWYNFDRTMQYDWYRCEDMEYWEQYYHIKPVSVKYLKLNSIPIFEKRGVMPPPFFI